MTSYTSPGVSVAIATYNGASYLQEQLESILCQTHKPAEIIVCDDQSTDGTESILRNYQDQGLLKYFINKEKLGVTGNFKKAVSLAAPENYIALSDQDDVWLPNKLELSLRKLSAIEDRLQPCFVYSDLFLVDTAGQLINPSFRNEIGQDGYRHCLKSLLFGNFVNGCTVVMNPAARGYLNAAPANFSLNHDYWIALSAFTFGRVGCIDQPLVRYRRHSQNATAVSTFRKEKRLVRLWKEVSTALNDDRFLREELVCVRKFYETFERSMDRRQRQVFEGFLKLQDRSYPIRKILAVLTLRGWV